MPSGDFIARCLAQIANPRIALYFNDLGTDYKPYVLSISQIKRDGSLTSGELIITVDVESFNQVLDIKSLMDGYTALAWTCELTLYFAEDDTEELTLFKGLFNSARFTDGDKKCELTFRTWIDILLAQTIGFSNTPVDYENSGNLNPSDLIWDILTTYAGLDATESTANIDIDYTSFLWLDTWLTEGSGAANPYCLQGRFTGESLRNALLKICDLTETSIFPMLNGKVGFNSQAGYTTGQTYGYSNIYCYEFIVSHDERLNQVNGWYGYDPDAGTWVAGIGANSPAFDTYKVNAVMYEEDITLWHKNLNSAERFANETIGRVGLPVRRIKFETGLRGFLEEIGNVISVYGLACLSGIEVATPVIEEIILDVNRMRATITARWDWVLA